MRIVPSASTSPLGPILGLEPLIGLLVMVVWWDVVIATPFPVQYQAEQCHFKWLNVHAKHDFLEKVTLKVRAFYCTQNPSWGYWWW